MLDLCCPAGNNPVTEQCFQRLIFKDTNSNTLPINNFEGDGSFEVILPPGVTGDRCVMRWIWITGKTEMLKQLILSKINFLKKNNYSVEKCFSKFATSVHLEVLKNKYFSRFDDKLKINMSMFYT